MKITKEQLREIIKEEALRLRKLQTLKEEAEKIKAEMRKMQMEDEEKMEEAVQMPSDWSFGDVSDLKEDDRSVAGRAGGGFVYLMNLLKGLSSEVQKIGNIGNSGKRAIEIKKYVENSSNWSDKNFDKAMQAFASTFKTSDEAYESILGLAKKAGYQG